MKKILSKTKQAAENFLWGVAIVLLVCLLGACAPAPIIKYKYLGDPVPDALIQDCTVTAPPAKDQYTSSTWEQKEELLSQSLQGTYKDLTKCNDDKSSLREWKRRQEQLKAEQMNQRAK